MIVPGHVKCILIEGCCLLERFLIGRYLGKTLVDGLRDILDNARWVVGFRVYIEWDVSWFRIYIYIYIYICVCKHTRQRLAVATRTLNQRFSLLNQSLTESGFACHECSWWSTGSPLLENSFLTALNLKGAIQILDTLVEQFFESAQPNRSGKYYYLM